MNSFVKIAFFVCFLMVPTVGFCYPFGPEPEEIADSYSFFESLIILSCSVATIFYLYGVICDHTKSEHPWLTAIAMTVGLAALSGYFLKPNGLVVLAIVGFYSMYKIYTYKAR